MNQVKKYVPLTFLTAMLLGQAAIANNAENIEVCNAHMITALKDIDGLRAEKYTQKQTALSLAPSMVRGNWRSAYTVYARNGADDEIIAKANCIVSSRQAKVIYFSIDSLVDVLATNYLSERY